MHKPYLTIIFLLFATQLTFGQTLPDMSAYQGKKIITIVKNREIPDSTLYTRLHFKTPLSIDSSQNNTVVTYWESSIKNNGQNVTLNTRPTRFAVAYKDNPNYFFDSDKPVKLTHMLDLLFRRSSDRLVNKNMKERVVLEKTPELYEIRALDTLRFSDLFFNPNIPSKIAVNDTWVDSVKQKYVSIADTFIVKSIDKDIITLEFKNKLTINPKEFEELMKQTSNGENTMNSFNTADYVQGTIVFDLRTLFIHSVTGKITVFTGSEVNGVTRPWHSFQTGFNLTNTIE